MAEKKSGPFTLLKAVPLVLLAFIILIPLSIYFILSMGFPPVVGNLAAAQSIRKYAAQVYPEWEPQGIWAGYNLVTDGYYLTFSNGEEKYTLDYAWPEDRVEDKTREEELFAQAELDRATRTNGLWIPDRLTTHCSVRWTSKDPNTPLFFLTLRFYTEPGLTEAELREQIADAGMKAYQALSPLLLIHQLSIHCGQRETGEEITWTILTLELKEGVPVTWDTLRFAPVTVK